MPRFIRDRRPFFVALLGLALIMFGLPLRGSVKANDTLNAGDVLVGPCGLPGAMGANSVDDDFTNLSLENGISDRSLGNVTTAPGVAEFRNTIQNTGGSDDVFMISAPIVPPGFTLQISQDYGDHYVALGAPALPTPVSIGYKASATLRVRIKAPAGLKLLSSFDTVIRATSTLTPSASNDTIDRLYTSFIKIEKSTTILNADGAKQPKHGSVIEFVFSYSNLSTAAGVGNSLLTARNLVISENGNSAPNTWAQTTDHIVGASDSQGGVIIGDHENSTSLTDIVTALEPGQSGVFKFRRRVK